MRRNLVKKSVDTSSEKKNRDTIIRSIAVEEGVLDKLRVAQTEVAFEVDQLESKKEISRGELDVLESHIKEKESLLASLQEDIISAQSEVSGLKDEKEKLLSEIEEVKASLKKIQDDYNTESVRIGDVREKEALLHKQNIDTLVSIIADLEAKVDVLTKSESQISSDIDSKQKEQSSLDVSLAHRIEELARINRDLATSQTASLKAEREYKDIEIKIANIQTEMLEKDNAIKAKNEELSEREKEVENKRKELLSVMLREKKLQEREGAVKDLFDLAGIKV